MAHWLIKSEPETWSWDDQVKAGVEQWDGVRNYQARNNMTAMSIGDRVFFYHSVKEKEVVGIVEVASESHPDTTDTTGKWTCVDFRAVRPFRTPVSLDQIKSDPRLADMVLVKNSRLSVQPVSDDEWRLVCALGNTDPD